VYEALLMNKQLLVHYSPRGQEENKEYTINPLGLVLKDGLFYLICTLWDYSDFRLLVLHRILDCQIQDVPAIIPDGFNIDAYIASGELDFSVGNQIQLKVLFEASAAVHLGERPLSSDQTIEKQDDGRVLISATVIDSSELRWWLLGFGQLVEVVEPHPLRDDVSKIAKEMSAHYA